MDSRFKGPFEILSRPSASTILIKVGLNADSSNRTELRHWSDVRPAYLRPEAVEAERPKRGRPRKKDVNSDQNTSETNVNNGIQETVDSPNLDEPFHGFATQASVDFSKPPPPFPKRENLNVFSTAPEVPKAWSASQTEIDRINNSISAA